MKLRQTHEDFKVEEIHDIIISQNKDNYKVYTVEKSGIESFYLLNHLAKENNIPASELAIAGLKDKHAETKQYLTIPAKYDIKTVSERNFRLTFLGYTSSKIRLGDLAGNRFEITVRDVKNGEIEGIYQKASTIKSIGVPNYFDSQRFGSVMRGKFMAKEIMQKNYEAAVKIFLTEYTKSENRMAKDDKKNILSRWGNLSAVKANNYMLAAVLEEYKRTKDWLKAYRRIPGNLREIYISAYQSHIWNECIKEILRTTVNTKVLYSIEYTPGSLLFYKKLTGEEQKKIPKTFNTASDELVPADHEKKIISKILSKEGITIDDFKIKQATGNFFKTRERQVIIKPEEFKISQPMLDEINDTGKGNRFKIVVSFALPKASYATIIIKRLFNQ